MYLVVDENKSFLVEDQFTVDYNVIEDLLEFWLYWKNAMQILI